MSEWDEYAAEDEIRFNERVLNALQNDWANIESLEFHMSEYVGDMLNDFYHQRVAPLERQLRKLGEEPEQPRRWKVEKCYNFSPNKSLLNEKEPDSWNHPEGLYQKVLTNLLDACIGREWIEIQEPMTKKNLQEHWLAVFGCEFSGDEFPKIKHPLKWRGNDNLCIYLMKELEECKVISSSTFWKVVETNFDIKGCSSKWAKLHDATRKTFGKPQDHELVDRALAFAYDEAGCTEYYKKD